MNCPCGNKIPYLNCCGLFIEKNLIPQTPEQLMRSRYSAYALNNIDYIRKTMRGEPKKGFSIKHVYTSNADIIWQSLRILEVTDNTVEFEATYVNIEGNQQLMREKSLFKQKNGRWYYVGIAN